jgi:hypothetical protein
VKREIPLLIVAITGLIMFIQYFVPMEPQGVANGTFINTISRELFARSQDWVIIIGILSIPLGIWSLLKANVQKLTGPKGERFYAGVLLVGFLAMVLSGLTRSSIQDPGSVHTQIFTTVLIPIQATIFSLLAFFVASAAYRAFRARSVLATILLLTAFIVMLRFIPLGPISTWNQSAVAWIIMVPNMAAKRAIGLGLGLGAVATAIKIIIGVERTYLGHD